MQSSQKSVIPPAGTSIHIEGYELLGRIGRGPRAEVWRARTRGGTEVALKVFFPHLTRAPTFVSAFEKETSALTALTHPNILAALERGRSNGYYFVTCEWMLHGSLRELIHMGPVAPERAVHIGLGVCEALDYAHRRGLPHRNLVPENIFVDGADRVRVSDFGLSLLSGRGLLDGDARADLQALGAVIYELVSGSSPGGDPTPLGRRLPGIPARLDELVSRALAPRASERFGRASELALALRLVTSGKSNGAAERKRSEAVDFTITSNTITITVTPDATETDAEALAAKLDAVLGQQGAWRLAYDLGRLNVMDDAVRSVLLRMHIRHQKNLERIAFCSPRALVRSSALVLGGSVKRIPWKTFASAAPMHAWIEAVSP